MNPDKPPARILPFASVGQDRVNREADEEILDRVRAEEVASEADDGIYDLDLKRLLDGFVDII